MQPFVRNVLGRQRKRVVASILEHIERTVKDRLSEEEWHALRGKVLGAVAQYHDACLDLVDSSVNDGMMLNEEAVKVLADFNEAAQRMQRIETLAPLIFEPKPERIEPEATLHEIGGRDG